ncbi:RND family efflux transporter, MFP subunit [Terriglobus roseus DSM 18391]|uniref:RND family efflux transporter, MFP subunit n=1 Tax=Terriglobus roseus (strain DSM 18391 / NRRL B-41598 / KBS 63) TaxID=926566 RepID=I3ZCM4_TERRK|nr:efflux RND transporter periplasmic adaptor subunit [Terriglobus roseus]AFL86992.1 RND family efflux transporter, MFP subunit [Terriglobus roseus DSM 18391]
MLPLSSEHSATSSPEHPALPEHASPSSTGLPNDASQHPEAPRKSSWLRIVVLILIVGAIGGFIAYRLMHKPATAAGGPGGPGGGRRGGAGQIVPVSFDVATMKTIPIQLTALGTVTAYNTVTLKSRVDGQITRVNFTEGQRVKQGQLLIEIDPRPYQATLSVAQGNLVRDQANAALAQAQAQRYQQLYAAGVVSKESTQTQESTAGQAVGTLAADRAAIQQAQVNVNYTRITSPINGVVGLRQVDVGNIVSAAGSTGLVVITQLQPIAVIFTLPEDQIPAVFQHMRGGHKLMAEAWDRSNSTKLATGSLLTIDNQIDTTTGTAKLKAVFDNADSALFPNQFVNIHLILENRPNSLVIPAAAVQSGNGGSFVYVIDRSQPQTGGGATAGAGGRPAGGGQSAAGGAPAGGSGSSGNTGAESSGGGPVGGGPGGGASSAAGGRRSGGAAGSGPQTNYPVRVAQVVVDSSQGTDVIIKSGLKAGDQVVTDGTEKLQAGSRVVPHPSTELAAARGSRGQAAAGGSPDAGADAFSNGRASDRDPGTPGGPRHRANGTAPTDSTGLTTSHGPNDNRSERGSASAGSGEQRRRPAGAPPTQ